MKRKSLSKITSILLILSLLLTGCSSGAVPQGQGESTTAETEQSEEPANNEEIEDLEIEESAEPAANNDVVADELEEIVKESSEDITLDETQMNSVAMLNYLAMVSTQIEESKNRLYLKDTYDALYDNTNPEKIDEDTLEQIRNLNNIIHNLDRLQVKRERLEYLYNQDKAAAISSAVPNPLAILSVAESFDWKRLVATVVYTVVDTYKNYKTATAAVDREYLLSGWELDDEESNLIHNNRDRAFNYMVTIVSKERIPKEAALNSKVISSFLSNQEESNIYSELQFLETEEEIYKYFGPYWLERASCYYDNNQYEECLNCISKYEDLYTGIFRYDYDYADIMPKAIVAAQETLSGDDYVSVIEKYTNAIRDNAEKENQEDWSLRYFAAQSYIDLYKKTGSSAYLEEAYELVLSNVRILSSEQKALNEEYLAEIVEVEVPEIKKNVSDDEKKKLKEEQKQAKAYNKALKEKRETELPPVYEPLIVNCDLLYALAEELDITDSKKKEIEGILEVDNAGVFMTEELNKKYTFNWNKQLTEITFNNDEIIIPAILLTEGATISVNIESDSVVTTFNDWEITEVERKDAGISSFYAYYSGSEIKKYKWAENAIVVVTISNGTHCDAEEYQFKLVDISKRPVINDKLTFEAL